MALFRNVQISFWEDTKVEDDFTPEDKYFMLYCLTNKHTDLCGCYEVSINQMSKELGYDKLTVEKLVNRFKNIHKVIDYDYENKELLIKNWNKYNWTKSDKLDKPLLNEISNIKTNRFKAYLGEIYNKRDTVSIPYEYPMDTTIAITDTITNTIIYNKLNNKKEEINKEEKIIENVIEELNKLTGSQFRSNSKTTIKDLKALLKDYTEEEIITVVRKMYIKWGNNTKMRDYLRPSTLFRRSNFENYLGMNVKVTVKDLNIDTSDF